MKHLNSNSKYITKSGKTITLKVYTSTATHFAWRGSNGFYYKKDGQSPGADAHQIVREKLNLKEGGTYLDRQGELVTVWRLSAKGRDCYAYDTGSRFSAGDGRCYREDGSRFGKIAHHSDLIEEVPSITEGATSNKAIVPAMELNDKTKYVTRRAEIITLKRNPIEDETIFTWIGSNGHYYTDSGDCLGSAENDILSKFIRRTRKPKNKPKDTKPPEVGKAYGVVRDGETVFLIRSTDTLKELPVSVVDWSHAPEEANSLEYREDMLYLPAGWYWDTSTRTTLLGHGNRWTVNPDDKAVNLDKLDKTAIYYRPQ